MFSLICAWIKAWVNNREAGDLRRHSAHYDVTVIFAVFVFSFRLWGPSLTIWTTASIFIVPNPWVHSKHKAHIMYEKYGWNVSNNASSGRITMRPVDALFDTFQPYFQITPLNTFYTSSIKRGLNLTLFFFLIIHTSATFRFLVGSYDNQINLVGIVRNILSFAFRMQSVESTPNYIFICQNASVKLHNKLSNNYECLCKHNMISLRENVFLTVCSSMIPRSGIYSPFSHTLEEVCCHFVWTL